MTDDRPHVPRVKGRSASICAASYASSMEAIPPSGASPDAGTPQSRRRRPAARSQSARLTNKRSVRSKTSMAPASGGMRSQSNSEPKLAEQDTTPDVSPNIKRKGSQRRGTSVYQRKSAAFLDVPDARGRSNSNTEEEDEDSYRLRSFSFTSKGEFDWDSSSIDVLGKKTMGIAGAKNICQNYIIRPPSFTILNTYFYR
ncbi:hypothetical protein NQ317_017909 [Molorchus minor]|uniref:Uncharacterized protein n=1 Tax=Molorchus minor TaxID=1323400 RepID=A0ABQ9J705_9CUCU|nr:hypothetical protein NQ317_017909 [Molorchus minor]